MSREKSYVAKWVTVEGEVQAKRFQASSYPRVEPHGEQIGPGGGPVLYDVYSDEERVLTVMGHKFISITNEDA